jgi:hypothetical protein
VDTKFLELLNATLGMSILLVMFILIRDFRKQVFEKDNRIKVAFILMGAGIFIFSLKEFIKYGITKGKDAVHDELLETLYLLLTLGAFFSLLTIKELPSGKMKEK